MKKWCFLVGLLFLLGCSVSELDIPYHKQEGPSCVQSQMVMAIKYYDPLNSVTQVELDSLTGREEGQWTWFSQALPVLVKDFEMDAYYYSETPYYSLRPETVNDIYGAEDGEFIKSVTNWEALDSSIEYLRNSDRYEHRKLTWQEVEYFFSKKYVVMMIIDYNVLVGKEGVYAGHGVTITKLNETHVIFHNSNLGPNQVALKEDFVKAWNAPGTDNDVIVVRGKL